MARTSCKNPKCTKRIKSTREFCSVRCFANYKKDNPELYSKGTFKKGEDSWNKGKRFTKIGDTFIRKSVTKSGDSRDKRYVCYGYNNDGSPKYIRNDKFVWLLANGPIPKGHIIYHKDGRTLNDDLDNLECIKIGIALSRYSILRRKKLDLSNPLHIIRIKEGCINGDTRIQRQLYDMMNRKCTMIASKYVSRDADVVDIVNTSFVKIFNNMHQVDPNKKALSNWITKIIVNTAIDASRKSRKIEMLTDSIDYNYGDSDDEYYNPIRDKLFIDESFSENSDIKYLTDIIETLSPQYKEVFNLIVIDGLSHKESAKILGISEGTSKSNFSRARKYLKEKILEFNNAENNSILNTSEFEYY